MSEFKGTPAPWATRANSGAIDVFHLYSDGSGSSSPHAKIYDSFFKMEKMRADAYLIAAAPELFEAVKACLPLADPDGNVNGVNIVAALRKALGEAK